MLVEIAALVLLAIACFKWRFGYWKRKGVASARAWIPFGSVENPLTMRANMGVQMKDCYDRFKAQGSKHGGLFFFTRPVYMPIELGYLKRVMVGDFDHFVDKFFTYCNEKDDPASASLVSLRGEEWKRMRARLSPAFTSKKMKDMFPGFLECAKRLKEETNSRQAKGEALDIRTMADCYTMDVIAKCAFGLDCDSFADPNSPFKTNSDKVASRTKIGALVFLFSISFPSLSRSLGIRVYPKSVVEFYTATIKEALDRREKSNVKPADVFQHVIGAKDNNENLTIEQITAQSLFFIVAGYETSAATLSFCLYELAINQDVQDKTRGEIAKVLAEHGGRVTFESIMDMKYLEQVVDETLRKHPALPFFAHTCVKDYHLPEEDLVIEKGTAVVVSVLGLHHDPEHFPEPERFRPERFDAKGTKASFAFMPFGKGPRNCIGLRIALQQIKVGLVVLLKDFKFALNPRTKLPLELKARTHVARPKDEIWLDATPVWEKIELRNGERSLD